MRQRFDMLVAAISYHLFHKEGKKARTLLSLFRNGGREMWYL